VVVSAAVAVRAGQADVACVCVWVCVYGCVCMGVCVWVGVKRRYGVYIQHSTAHTHTHTHTHRQQATRTPLPPGGRPRVPHSPVGLPVVCAPVAHQLHHVVDVHVLLRV
jgi:hypothetical protein